MVVKVAQLHELEAEFFPLYQGTIWRLFEWKPPIPREGTDPRSLPQIKEQCVHVTVDYITLADGKQIAVNPKRCLKDSEMGFLCEKHDWSLLSQPVTNKAVKPERDMDLEVAEGVVKYEQRAISRSQVEVKKVGRTSFRTIKGLIGRHIDPNKYKEYELFGVDELEE